MKKLIGSVLTVVGFALVQSGCGQDDSRLRAKAKIEGAENAREQIDAENRNRDERAKQLEEDLVKRQRFMDALSGSFEGDYAVKDDFYGERTYRVRAVVVSSLPPYVPSQRIRTPEEITSDLSNLFLNVVVNESNLESGDGNGCAFEKIKPDFENGELHLISAGCKKSYSLGLALPDEEVAEPEVKNSRIKVAKAVMGGSLSKVDELKGTSRATYWNKDLALKLKRAN